MVERLSVVAALVVAVETAASIVRHVLPTGCDPIRGSMSHCGVGPYRACFLLPAVAGGLAWPLAPRPPPAWPAATREGRRDRRALSLRQRREPLAFPPRPTRPSARYKMSVSGDHVRCGPRLSEDFVFGVPTDTRICWCPASVNA